MTRKFYTGKRKFIFSKEKKKKGKTSVRNYPNSPPYPYSHLRRKILIAYDNSEFSQKMFEWTLAQVLRSENDHVVLATVLDVQESTYFHRNWGADSNAGNVKHAESFSFSIFTENVLFLQDFADRHVDCLFPNLIKPLLN